MAKIYKEIVKEVKAGTHDSKIMADWPEMTLDNHDAVLKFLLKCTYWRVKKYQTWTLVEIQKLIGTSRLFDENLEGVIASYVDPEIEDFMYPAA